MFTLKTLLSLPVWLSTMMITHALASPLVLRSSGFIDEDSKGTNQHFAAQLTGGESCGDKQLKQIRAGFAEMNILFATAQNPNFLGEAELEFFGWPSRIRNYTQMIEENLKRAAQYGIPKGGNGTKMPDIHVRCDDPNHVCDEGGRKGGKHTVYNIANEPHINFCDDYFDLDGLRDQVDNADDGESSKKLMLGRYYNRGVAWARMVMHISEVGRAIVASTVPNRNINATSEWEMSYSLGPMNTSVLAGVQDSQPYTVQPNDIRQLKYAYGVTRSKLLASLSTQDPYDAANNADNYALYALSRYIIFKKGFYPNMPIMDFGNDMAVITNDMIQDGDKKKYSCFEMPDVVPLMRGVSVIGTSLPSSAPTHIRVWDKNSIALAGIFVSILGNIIL